MERLSVSVRYHPCRISAEFFGYLTPSLLVLVYTVNSRNLPYFVRISNNPPPSWTWTSLMEFPYRVGYPLRYGRRSGRGRASLAPHFPDFFQTANKKPGCVIPAPFYVLYAIPQNRTNDRRERESLTLPSSFAFFAVAFAPRKGLLRSAPHLENRILLLPKEKVLNG